MNIKDLVDSIKNHRVMITDHADEETQEDDLIYNDICHSVFQGEIIEDYPDDKPFPSCLVLSKNKKNEVIHSVWAYNLIRAY